MAKFFIRGTIMVRNTPTQPQQQTPWFTLREYAHTDSDVDVAFRQGDRILMKEIERTLYDKLVDQAHYDIKGEDSQQAQSTISIRDWVYNKPAENNHDMVPQAHAAPYNAYFTKA